MKNTLTDIENLGLQSRFNFADGHAYQDLNAFQPILERLPDLWNKAAHIGVKAQESLYRNAFAVLSQSPAVLDYSHFRICPTASNSIDVVAAWCRQMKFKVGLLEPTFDNLHLLLVRREVVTVSIQETELHQDIANTIEKANIDALFLVNPNNPTGQVLAEKQFREIVETCVTNDIALLLDNTFRFFVPQSYDQYQILIDSGVKFISIEDTGKVWPTLDMKASLIFYSPSVKQAMEVIYDEIYLCISPFSLAVLEEFLKTSAQLGLQQTIWDEVSKRRKLFRQAIQDSILRPDPISHSSMLSVEWVQITGGFESDLALAEYFQNKGLTLLPGRNFYWAKEEHSHTMNIRFSLLKPEQHFREALNALKVGLDEINDHFYQEAL
jgi:aspartate/methionine/tyrosine aminotransferase